MNTIDKACSSLNTPNRKPSELNHYFFRIYPALIVSGRDWRVADSPPARRPRCCRSKKASRSVRWAWISLTSLQFAKYSLVNRTRECAYVKDKKDVFPSSLDRAMVEHLNDDHRGSFVQKIQQQHEWRSHECSVKDKWTVKITERHLKRRSCSAQR